MKRSRNAALEKCKDTDVREADKLGRALRGRDGQLYVAQGHRDLGFQATLVVNVGVHLQTRLNKVRQVGSNLSHKLDTSRWHECHLTLWMEGNIKENGMSNYQIIYTNNVMTRLLYHLTSICHYVGLSFLPCQEPCSLLP